MKQLIARIDDDLHANLKRRAAAEGRSMNALVTELLSAGPPMDERARLRARAKALGLLREFPPPQGPVLTNEEVAEQTRGWGSAVSEALLADRRRR